MTYRLVHLLAGSALLFAVGAAGAAVSMDEATPAAQDNGVPHFDISRFDVQGNTLLGDAQVQALLAPFTGPQRDFSHLARAVEALEAAYRARGYGAVQVQLPEQELERGVVRLSVLQTPLGKVAISGNVHVDEANVRRALPALREGETPNLNALSQSLRLANENPARKIEVRLQADEQAGAIDAIVAVADEKAWKAMLNVDNTGNAQTGKTHVGVVLQHANLWGRDHVASLQYTSSLEKPDKVGVYGAGYHLPLYALGDSMDFFASYSNVDSGSVSAGIFDLAVSGQGSMAGIRYNQNFARRDDFEPKLVYGIDYKAYRNSVQLFGMELGADVTVHPLSVSYIGNWTLPTGETSVAVTFAHNIPGGKHGAQADFDRVRAHAKAGYNTLRLSASTARVLSNDWQWRALFNAQATPDALVPGEQFGAGGAASVRGFAEREVSNDSGASLNLELYTPNWCGQALGYQCRALAFYDTAWLRRNHALPGESASQGIGSAGLGLRLMLNRYANLQLDYAHVVNGGDTGQRGANRLHFRLALAY
ncbi:BamA/TamA family outer membrane protein [Janthinobacterium sp. SUN118]|uniref:ShlB/FhaC/HecB family hemolysin secretion/activation protein n=1 Tax=Janthinobacterium sp. SUN118 TaxID=3004100 RepID=UPI0025B24A59|nr:ShlB/FhaC/HecB family hemolysin secretion/activation protein [Janthinobacterium sp. SUN118]MDN2708924.1 BamA/TamA family outer membrane protein [Janthinobacterium sp. SUN118]